MPRKTIRIYYGVHAETGKPLYWTVHCIDAKKPVTLNGTVEHAMTGGPGLTIGCHMANMAKANAKAFGHAAHYVSFTKSGCKVVTKISKGQPSQCVRYRHGYGRYVDLNDRDPSKKVVRDHPELFNRQFTLEPYKPTKSHWKPEYGRKETGSRKLKMATGELDRMRKAGLVLQPLSA